MLRSFVAACIICCSSCCVLLAETTAYRSADGNLYLIRDSSSGPSWEKLTIVDMPGSTPTDPGPTPTPPSDRYGLIALSKSAADSVPQYPGRDDDRVRLAAFYSGVADAVAAGTIANARTPDGRTQVAIALDLAFSSAVGENQSKWSDWKTTVTNALNAAPLNSAADSAQALHDVSAGLVAQSEHAAIDWQKALEFFVTTLLPLIIRLISGMGVVE